MNTISCHTSPSLLSIEEKSKATHYLVSTRDALIEAVSRLSGSQWEFKPAPDRWSIAENLEHIVLVENRIHAIIGRMPDAPVTEPERIDSPVDELVLTKVPQRFNRVQAGPQVTPSRQWSPEESLDRFRESRDQTVQLLASAASLRGHVVPHPAMGSWDGYQWILAAAAHTSRHTEQILEVKSDDRFPKAPSVASAPLS